MQRLNICIFSNLFPPINSGSSTFTWNFARNLVKQGHRVVIITARIDNTEKYEEKEGVIIYRIRSLRLPPLTIAHNFKWMTYTYLPQNIKWLNNLFEKEKFDLIHQQNHVFDTILSSSYLAKKFKLPLFLTVHTWAQHTNPFYNKVLSVLDDVSRRIIFNSSNVVISPDPVVKKYVEERHKISDSPIIPYGIDVTRPNQEDVQEIQKRFNLKDEPIILSLGHINALRDRIDLISAMPAVLNQFPLCKLLIVGEVFVQKPVELVKKLGIEKNVIFTGVIPHTQVPALFELSDIEAHTFNGPYPGPGIASMEAMAAGLPVVSGEISKEYDFKYLKNWENIVMVPTGNSEKMADALLKLLGNEKLRETIGLNAKLTLTNQYSWDSVCNQYLSIYKESINKLNQNANVGMKYSESITTNPKNLAQ